MFFTNCVQFIVHIALNTVLLHTFITKFHLVNWKVMLQNITCFSCLKYYFNSFSYLHWLTCDFIEKSTLSSRWEECSLLHFKIYSLIKEKSDANIEQNRTEQNKTKRTRKQTKSKVEIGNKWEISKKDQDKLHFSCTR